MPNWAEGIFRARGKKENMLNFIQNQLITLYDRPPEILVDEFEDDDNIFFTFKDKDDIDFEKNIYIKDLDRAILIYDDMPQLYKIEGENDEYIMVENFKKAWGVTLKEIEDLSKKYKIDIKVNVYELGMQFSIVYEVNRKGRVMHSEIKNYKDYNWDCLMPLLGG